MEKNLGFVYMIREGVTKKEGGRGGGGGRLTLAKIPALYNNASNNRSVTPDIRITSKIRNCRSTKICQKKRRDRGGRVNHPPLPPLIRVREYKLFYEQEAENKLKTRKITPRIATPSIAKSPNTPFTCLNISPTIAKMCKIVVLLLLLYENLARSSKAQLVLPRDLLFLLLLLPLS